MSVHERLLLVRCLQLQYLVAMVLCCSYDDDDYNNNNTINNNNNNTNTNIISGINPVEFRSH